MYIPFHTHSSPITVLEYCLQPMIISNAIDECSKYSYPQLFVMWTMSSARRWDMDRAVTERLWRIRGGQYDLQV